MTLPKMTLLALSAALISTIPTPTMAQVYGPTYTCKQDIKSQGLHMKTRVSGKVYGASKRLEKPVMQASTRIDVAPSAIKIGSGVSPAGDTASGFIVYQYVKPFYEKAGGTYVKDIRFDINDLKYNRVIGFDELDGTIKIILRGADGATLAELPIYGDIYYGKPALEETLGFSTQLSYGAAGGINASKDDRQSFVTRIVDTMERQKGQITVSVHDAKKGLSTNAALASFALPAHDVHGYRVMASQTLDADIQKLRNKQCPQ